MANDNPFQKRIRAYELGRVVESFFGKRNVSWYALGYAALLLLAIGWIPDGIADLFNCQWRGCGWPVCLECSYKILISFLIIAFFRWRILQAMRYQVTIAVNPSSPQPVQVLGLFLSPVATTAKEQEDAVAAITKSINEKSLALEFFDGKKWEMPLKAISYHKSRLKKVLLFTSSGAHGTSAMSGDFRKVVQFFYPAIQVDEIKSGGMNFEDVEEVFKAVENFFLRNEKENVKESDMLVDITGGQKTNSIAAAIATLATGRNFQYISTETKDVRVFDVRYMD
ncbi:MAG: hypothetical protein K9G39_04250 [Chlorobium sp.]|uniref:hypothetical protein n=1 Tax=Chlorobium sp. TaxID=1095 RepID=UPI0025B85EE3|nr:hypothetical protein [Chlorobium sp.]MCF8382794.1 hypothetical protein [Chlorobium sp.]